MFAPLGSPPRMRGKHYDEFNIMKYLRITPADAGKTVLPYNQHRSAGDHPRGCGENRKLWLYIVKKGGSPPRMRGKLYCFISVRRNNRITPADAGKTFQSYLAQNAGKDHPRGCGENRGWLTWSTATTGSPPRMRGKPHYNSSLIVRERITPADAGKTVRECPQICIHKGSPPRMRGKRHLSLTR